MTRKDQTTLLPLGAVEPLIACLRRDVLPTAVAAAHALVRLPLRPAEAGKVLESVRTRLIERPSDDAASDLLKAVAKVPGSATRMLLREVASGDNDVLRDEALEQLNTLGDPLLPGMLFKRPARHIRDTSRMLATGIIPAPMDGLALLRGRTTDPQAAFWLELAIARSTSELSPVLAALGQLDAMEQFDLEANFEGRWWAEESKLQVLPSRLTSELREGLRGALPNKQLAYLLAGYPPWPPQPTSATATEDVEGSILSRDDANAVGVRLVDSEPWFDWGKHNLSSPFSSPSWLANMDRGLAGRVVTAVLRNRLRESPERPELLMDGGQLSAFVIWMLPKDYQPELGRLFEIFCDADKEDGVTKFQTAAAAALNGSLSALLADLRPTFVGTDTTRKRLAAEFTELFVRYKNDPGVPTFGGGSGPAELASEEDHAVTIFLRPDIELTRTGLPTNCLLRFSLFVDSDGPIGVEAEEDWETLELEIVLALGGALTERPRRNMTVQRTSGRGSVEFPIVLAEDKTDSFELDLTVFCGGKYCGSVRQILKSATAQAPRRLAVCPHATAPDLTVRVASFTAGGAGTHWTFTLSPEVKQLIGPHTLRLDGFAESTARTADNFDRLFNQWITDGEADPAAYAHSIGKRIAEMAPQTFTDLYAALSVALGTSFSIQFVTDELDVPWELMIVPGNVEPLAVIHPVARWGARHEGYLNARLTAAPLWTVAPDYLAPADLPFAQQEAMALEALGATRLRPATRAHFVDLLKRLSRAPCTIHFTGHGTCDRASPLASTIELEGGETFSALQLDTTIAGLWSGCLLVINACEIGDGRKAAGAFGGWTDVCQRLGCAGLLAPLWEAEDDVAADVVTSVLKVCLTTPTPLAYALRDARQRGWRKADTYLAYLFYGDVTARFG